MSSAPPVLLGKMNALLSWLVARCSFNTGGTIGSISTWRFEARVLVRPLPPREVTALRTPMSGGSETQSTASHSAARSVVAEGDGEIVPFGRVVEPRAQEGLHLGEGEGVDLRTVLPELDRATDSGLSWSAWRTTVALRLRPSTENFGTQARPNN